MVRLLDRVVADVRPDEVQPFTPPSRAELDAIVRRRGEEDVWRSVGPNQFEAMEHQPFVGVPERFASVL
jgi:hypothetical protein